MFKMEIHTKSSIATDIARRAFEYCKFNKIEDDGSKLIYSPINDNKAYSKMHIALSLLMDNKKFIDNCLNWFWFEIDNDTNSIRLKDDLLEEILESYGQQKETKSH